jgi:phosphomannomutase
VPIFKAYDIRGLVPDELTVEDGYRIGRAYARFTRAREVAVGRDARVSSPELRDALVRGLVEEGTSVVDLGLVSTPMLYFAVDEHELGGGVMVTASHNPARYNGFKVCREHAIPVGEASGLKDVERIAGSIDGPGPGGGQVRPLDVTSGYVEHVLGVGSERPRLRVAIDCGNGMAAVGLEPLLERLPLEVERLYFEPDGRFPHHPADPLEPADLGVAFDGDADRAIFVDEHAQIVPSDLVTALLAGSQLRVYPGGRVLYDLRSSWATAETIEAEGGVPAMCRVGHSFVKAQMRDENAVFAGELSGHFYFRFSPTLVADDALAAFVALLDVLGRESRPLSELVAPLRRYFASGEINVRVGDPGALLEQVAAEHPEAPEVSHLDGLLVRYEDWWFNLRPSNTEPVLRLNLEARTEQRMIEERDRIVARMEAAA